MSGSAAGGGDTGKSATILTASLWFISTIAAAAIGVLVTRYLERPGPSVLIADIAISTQYDDRFPDRKTVTVPLKDPLFQAFAQNMWVRSFRSSTEALTDVQKKLDHNESRLESILQQLAVLRDELPEMRRNLEAPPTEAVAKAFFEQWEPLDDLLCDAILGDIMRGTFKPDKARNYQNAPSYFLVDYPVNDEGQKLTRVSEIGSKQATFCEGSKYADDTQAVANEVIPLALAHFDQPVLRRLLEDAAQEATKYDSYQQIKRDVSTYIQGYSRWAVALLITNSGGQAVSFGPDATLFVDTKDYSGFPDFVPMNVQSRSDKGDLQPVTVAAGESKLVTFVSKDLVIDDPNWRALLDIFHNHARRAFVVVHPEADVWANKPNVFSPVRPFGAASSGASIDQDTVATIFKSN